MAHETALKNLQNCKMGNMKIGDFNSHFKSLSGLVLDAPESIRMDYYKRALSGPIRRQAILRADWASAQTLSAKMTIATLASQQLDEANGVTHSKHLPPHSTHQMISVPQEDDSMEVDVINLSASNPSSFPKKLYVDECKRLKACTRCLAPYDDTHRTASGSATCPNAAATLAAKIQFLKFSKKSNLPKTVPHPPSGPPQPVQRMVAAISAPPPMAGGQGHPYHPPYAWPHPPSYPYGYPGYPPPPPPHSVQPAVPPPPPASQPSTNISAVFSEYADLYQPVYYDLPGVDLSSTVPTLSEPSDPPPSSLPPVEPVGSSSTSSARIDNVNVSSMTFTGTSSSDSRLILSVILLVGKRLIPARALVDSGSGATSLVLLSFININSLRLSGRFLSDAQPSMVLPV